MQERLGEPAGPACDPAEFQSTSVWRIPGAVPPAIGRGKGEERKFDILRFAMETPASPNPFEIRCENCSVSFPSETRTCIHCGAALGSRFSWGGGEEAEVPVEGEGSVARKMGSAMLWIALALSAVLARLCGEG